MEVYLHQNFILFPTLVLFLIIAGSIYFLGKGADVLVEEAVTLSMRWGVPKMVIGATIVSLGTTLPEATVSVLAAMNGNPDLALGNAIGSIITDTGLIIGIASLLGELPIDRQIVNYQGKLQVLAGFLLAGSALPFFSKGVTGTITQSMGLVFVLLLLCYLFITFKRSNEGNSEDYEFDTEEGSLFKVALKFVMGAALVILSSQVLIVSVEIAAVRVGVPQSIIAATIVAFGTSLPELVTAVTAVRKGHGELAIGNIVGADILNVLFVVGAAASVTKGGLVVPATFYKLQIPTMLLVLVLFRVFSIRKKAVSVIMKREGIFLLLIYGSYLVFNFLMV